MYSIMMRLSRLMAFLGGAVLIALVLLTSLSIAGRALNTLLHVIDTSWAHSLIALGINQITGDFELVEAGMGFAIFAFLPLCQITSGHAVVDVFTNKLPLGVQRVLACVTEIVFALVLILIATQLWDGMESKIRSGQTTFILGYPLWWGYAAALVGAVTAALVAVYIAAMRTAEMFAGRDILPAAEGAEH